MILINLLPHRELARKKRKESFQVSMLAAAMAAVVVVGLAKGDKHETKAAQALPDLQQTVAGAAPKDEWQYYGNSQGGQRFSPLEQLTPENVQGLEVAWTYRTGDYPPSEGKPAMRFEATPLKVGDSLFFCTAQADIVSLNAETGEERWRFKPNVNLRGVTGSAACRGVAYTKLPEPQPDGVCQERIFGPTADARLLAVDAKTGQLLGAHMIGAEVTELIQGYVVAMGLETTEEELMHTVFPHPTLSEMMQESVLNAYGRAIHI